MAFDLSLLVNFISHFSKFTDFREPNTPSKYDVQNFTDPYRKSLTCSMQNFKSIYWIQIPFDIEKNPLIFEQKCYCTSVLQFRDWLMISYVTCRRQKTLCWNLLIFSHLLYSSYFHRKRTGFTSPFELQKAAPAHLNVFHFFIIHGNICKL